MFHLPHGRSFETEDTFCTLGWRCLILKAVGIQETSVGSLLGSYNKLVEN